MHATLVHTGSRMALDRSVMICGLCGELEAMRDLHELPPLPPNEWPVAPDELGREFALRAAVRQTIQGHR
jgi:hypothetical protein